MNTDTILMGDATNVSASGYLSLHAIFASSNAASIIFSLPSSKLLLPWAVEERCLQARIPVPVYQENCPLPLVSRTLFLILPLLPEVRKIPWTLTSPACKINAMSRESLYCPVLGCCPGCPTAERQDHHGHLQQR